MPRLIFKRTLKQKVDIFWNRCYRKIRFNFKRLFFPYNNIRIKTLENRYHERDNLLLHGSFQLLVDYVEKELIPSGLNEMQNVEDAENELQTSIRLNYKRWISEILHLYVWWKFIRPKRAYPTWMGPKLIFDFESKCITTEEPEFRERYKEFLIEEHAFYEAIKEEDIGMLHRLVDMKDYITDL